MKTKSSRKSTAPRLLAGAHMPVAGGLYLGIQRGREIGCNTVQIFTKSPQQWAAKPLANDEIKRFRSELEANDIKPVLVHDSYLINLASPNKTLLNRSRRAFRDEMKRCHLLSIPYLVTHWGAATDGKVDDGLKRLAESLSPLLDSGRSWGVTILLETTAGQGNTLGDHFEHFPQLFELLGDKDGAIGVCLDTCHVFAAGYNLRTPTEYRKTMKAFDSLVGLKRLKAIHVNDSQTTLGSRVDRHAHLGEGQIGLEAFRLLVNDRRLQHVPFILETPQSDTMHAVNLKRLKSLVRPQKSE